METSQNALRHNGLIEIKETGIVKDIRQGIARIEGFPSCIFGQIVRFSGGAKGIVIGFNEKDVMVLVLGDETSVRSGEEISSQVEPFRVPVGTNFVGRVVNALAEPIDRRGSIESSDYYPLFREAVGVIDRMPIEEGLETGIKIIDTCLPIGRGQRELIIGDRMSGKTTISLDTILNQKGKDVTCIYCCIGRSHSSLLKIIQLLQEHKAMDYTIVVAATGADSANAQYLAPYTAAALGEYFMFNGKHVFVTFDDLTRHAWAWRQVALLMDRSPGREAYPGDIFYTHSSLLERAGKLNKAMGEGSMTFFPIVETLQGDFSGYIQTNLISITDGQVYLSTQLFFEGFKPAIDLGLSVSRIGSKAQCPAIRDVSKMLRLEYVQYRDLLKMTRLRTRYSPEVEAKLKRGQILTTLLTQDKSKPLSVVEEIILFYAYKIHMLDLLSPEDIQLFKTNALQVIKDNYPYLVATLEKDKKLNPEITTQLDKALMELMKRLKAKKEQAV